MEGFRRASHIYTGGCFSTFLSTPPKVLKSSQLLLQDLLCSYVVVYASWLYKDGMTVLQQQQLVSFNLFLELPNVTTCLDMYMQSIRVTLSQYVLMYLICMYLYPSVWDDQRSYHEDMCSYQLYNIDSYVRTYMLTCHIMGC